MEAVSNTIASTISGVVIGVGIAALVSIQMNLLTEAPFSMYIPVWLLLGMLILTILLNVTYPSAPLRGNRSLLLPKAGSFSGRVCC